jgi:methylglutaconyl-CoA hydratase
MVYSKEQSANIFEQHFAFLLVDETDHVFTVTLNRPETRNAFHQPYLNELAYALSYAHHNNQIWAVVIKANGPVFCAGADLKAFAGMEVDLEGSTIPMPNDMFVIGDQLKGLHKPLIAQVHGDVYAGGFLMIGGCTHVIAAETAKFGLPEVKRGIWPMQVMASLMPIMNARQMLDLCMRGKILSAHEALQMGIATAIVPAENLEKAVQDLVADIKNQSPSAIRLGLEAFQAMDSIPANEQHKYLHKMLMKVLQTSDAKEGLAAFREKRSPVWKGE